jgi:hypothetical protein
MFSIFLCLSFCLKLIGVWSGALPHGQRVDRRGEVLHRQDQASSPLVIKCSILFFAVFYEQASDVQM